MKITKRFHIINIIIFFSLILLPLSVLASVPTTTDFDRHNEYPTDGFRDGGYYAVRDNSSIMGYMNMSHTGGTPSFEIETYNIQNVTLDFDLMFEKRSFLFGWATVTWEDAVDSLGNDIFINITTDGTLNSMRFVDQPNVWVRVWKNNTIYKGWELLSDVELDSTGFSAGTYEIIIEFQDSMTIYDILSLVLQVMIVVGIILLIIRSLRSVLFGDDGNYYRRAWK